MLIAHDVQCKGCCNVLAAEVICQNHVCHFVGSSAVLNVWAYHPRPYHKGAIAWLGAKRQYKPTIRMMSEDLTYDLDTSTKINILLDLSENDPILISHILAKCNNRFGRFCILFLKILKF